MDTTTVLAIAIPVLVVLGGLVAYAASGRRDADGAVGRLSRAARRSDRSATAATVEEAPAVRSGREVERAARLERSPSRELVPAGAPPPAPWVPPDPETLGVTRRQFMNRGILTFFGLGVTGFGTACLAFLWPSLSGGFGSAIKVGAIPDIKQRIADGNGFYYYAEGRMWITEYPTGAIDKARAVYSESELSGMEAGVIALYQKCVHLGCRVPACETSQWFECPCHGSQYNQVGEKKGGPAPRGLDRFAMTVDGGVLTVDTGVIIQGPPIGTNTTGQEAEGPHCISSGGGHG
ncbi:MAG TPA: Rieske 2Fe-2S domain-containing protein [Acidimicrobiales bacterium]|jgi:cytochrome b6-f complex iron-sulfur subunit